MVRPPAGSTLFPYTTLFRSLGLRISARGRERKGEQVQNRRDVGGVIWLGGCPLNAECHNPTASFHPAPAAPPPASATAQSRPSMDPPPPSPAPALPAECTSRNPESAVASPPSAPASAR